MVIMFEEEQLDSVFNSISSTLSSPIEGFLIGGLAMIKNRMKIATKDIDIVFSNEDEAREFIGAAEKVGFKPDAEVPPEYEEMDTMMVLKDEEERRIDVFVRVVLGSLTYTESMKGRAGIFSFGDKLTIRTSSNEDIFLYKAITSRPRDVNDMEALARTGDLDWDIIEDEARNQPTPWKWIGRLFSRLGELEDETGIVTPLTSRLEKEAEIAQALEILLAVIEDRAIDRQEATQILREDEKFVDEVIAAMIVYGLIKEDGGKYILTGNLNDS